MLKIKVVKKLLRLGLFWQIQSAFMLRDSRAIIVMGRFRTGGKLALFCIFSPEIRDQRLKKIGFVLLFAMKYDKYTKRDNMGNLMWLI